MQISAGGFSLSFASTKLSVCDLPVTGAGCWEDQNEGDLSPAPEGCTATPGGTLVLPKQDCSRALGAKDLSGCLLVVANGAKAFAAWLKETIWGEWWEGLGRL